MCDDGSLHSFVHAAPADLPGSGLSRRRMLQGMVALAGLASLAACTSDSSGAVAPGSRAPSAGREMARRDGAGMRTRHRCTRV